MGSDVAQVRRFNRLVTERAGALDDRFLGQARPLGQARLLWEVGEAGAEVGALRARLGLDSGYASRLLRALEAEGLVSVVPSPRDRRVRHVRLTARGQRERARLDERSDAAAAALLDPLAAPQRERLVRAMGEVERLLTAASVEIGVADRESAVARVCLDAYFDELRSRSGHDLDPATAAAALPDELRPPEGQFFVATLHGEPVGCGAVKHPAGRPAHVKRMWVAPAARGLGLGRRLLDVLEACAREAGATVARLETGAVLSEALALYRSAGWVEVAPFNDEPFADHWLEKPLRAWTGSAGTRDRRADPRMPSRRAPNPG